jgi:Tol biopolymer transport system component
LYIVPAAGNKDARRISPEEWRCENGEWLADGTGVVLVRQEGSSNHDIWLQPLSGSPRPLVTTPASEQQPAVSPNGRWLAYVSDETGTKEVYVRDNRTGVKSQVSTGNAVNPRWARDARRLFYRKAPFQIGPGLELLGGELMTVAVQEGASAPLFPKPRALFGTPGLRGDFDVYSDGRFLAISVPNRWSGIAVVLN